ncbi:MAG: glycosyltransferase [Oscillospiraceae bacterium]|nr:glycosyltransferase [Oscillospiraceae bacterium]
MKQIICLSHTPWGNRPNRTQQLLSRLKGVSVLFFEPPADKPEARGRKVRPNVMVYQLLKTAGAALVSQRGWRRVTDCVERAMARHRFREPVLWCTTPQNVHLLDYLACRGVVYDCHRYWSNLPARWEGELAASADICFAASEGLADRLAPCSGNIALLPNGVNFPLFSKEIDRIPPDMADLKGRPVLGFVGALTSDLLIKPLLHCAEAHPDWAFVLIGPVAQSEYLPQLEERDNIRVLGPRPLVDIPEYLAACDVCLQLLRRRNKDSDVLPARIYEYLAAGKPVASMLWQYQQEDFPNVVYYARTVPDFEAQCRRAVEEDPAALRRRRRDYGRAAAWDNRAAQVAQLLEGNGLWPEEKSK